MNPGYRLIEGPYLRDLLNQPEALWNTSQALADCDLADLPGQLSHGAFDRLILTGMGASLNALHSVLPDLAGTGIPVISVETSELLGAQTSLLTSRSLLLAVSQSGRSAEIQRLASQIPPGCRLVGITNTPGSPLAQRSNPIVLTVAGPENSVSCKTYLATLAALRWFTDVLRGAPPVATAERLGDWAAAAADYLSWWRDHVEALAGLLAATRQIYVTGRGPSLAAALTAALILKEAARFPAEGMSTAAFRHGPIEMAAPEVAVFVLAGLPSAVPLNHRLCADLQATQAKAFLVEQQDALPPLKLPSVPTAGLPVMEILPFQMMSLALAALEGREAGHFRWARKITQIE